MTLRTSTRIDRGVAIITLAGRITLGEASGALRDSVKNVLAQGCRKIVIDLSKVSYIDSGGLGELVGCYASASNVSAEIRLLNPQSRVEALMDTTRLSSVFLSFADEKNAMASFDDAVVMAAAV